MTERPDFLPEETTNSPIVSSEEAELLTRLREIDKNKNIGPFVQKFNENTVKLYRELHGEDTITTLLPTNSPSYARVMNILLRNGFFATTQLIDRDLDSFRELPNVGKKTLPVIEIMRNIAIVRSNTTA